MDLFDKVSEDIKNAMKAMVLKLHQSNAMTEQLQ